MKQLLIKERLNKQTLKQKQLLQEIGEKTNIYIMCNTHTQNEKTCTLKIIITDAMKVSNKEQKLKVKAMLKLNQWNGRRYLQVIYLEGG